MKNKLSLLFALFLGVIAPVLGDENPRVLVKTTLGNFTLELDGKKAPISTDNFLGYVEDGFYDNVIFHRVIPGFMVQGGGFASGMQEKKNKKPIENEAQNGLKNNRGTIAMARTNEINSATAQFFINLVDNNFLNHSAGNFGYAVFGTVTEGMETLDKIAEVATGNVGHFGDVPLEEIFILKTEIVK